MKSSSKEKLQTQIVKREDFCDFFSIRAKDCKFQGWLFLAISVISIGLVGYLIYTRYDVSTDFMLSGKALNNEITRKHGGALTKIEEIDFLQLNSDKLKLKKSDSTMINRILDNINKFNDLTDSLYKQNTTIINTLEKEYNASFIERISGMIITSLIGFFLIQIFLKLYRYNMSMASYYQAISDAFKILEEEKKNDDNFIDLNLDDLMKVLVPHNINLDVPDSPKINIPDALKK